MLHLLPGCSIAATTRLVVGASCIVCPLVQFYWGRKLSINEARLRYRAPCKPMGVPGMGLSITLELGALVRDFFPTLGPNAVTNGNDNFFCFVNQVSHGRCVHGR